MIAYQTTLGVYSTLSEDVVMAEKMELAKEKKLYTTPVRRVGVPKADGGIKNLETKNLLKRTSGFL